MIDSQKIVEYIENKNKTYIRINQRNYRSRDKLIEIEFEVMNNELEYPSIKFAGVVVYDSFYHSSLKTRDEVFFINLLKYVENQTKSVKLCLKKIEDYQK